MSISKDNMHGRQPTPQATSAHRMFTWGNYIHKCNVKVAVPATMKLTTSNVYCRKFCGNCKKTVIWGFGILKWPRHSVSDWQRAFGLCVCVKIAFYLWKYRIVRSWSKNTSSRLPVFDARQGGSLKHTHKVNGIFRGCTSGVMVIVVGNGHGDTSSNPGRDWLHIT